MKNWKPWYLENSKIPVWCSYLAPTDMWALSFACFVWCRGKLTDSLKRHETIHFQQQLELLFVFQWVLYILFWLRGYIKYRSGAIAYIRNPFEQEAYGNQHKTDYLSTRKRYSWWKYKI